MRFKKLLSICNYVNEKIDINKLSRSHYISTENMLPDKGGITAATVLPKVNKTQSFKINDILISNIRPYFKKIWKANFNGGCSNDIIVIRASSEYDSAFLYYVLSSDNFFSFVMSTAKGTKMPRGDKEYILNYDVPDFDKKTQEKIARLLFRIDKKITLNNLINDNLAA